MTLSNGWPSLSELRAASWEFLKTCGENWSRLADCWDPADSISADADTIVLGLHLTVEPVNLANALVAWKDAANEDPDALLDRIEQILRGKTA